MEINPADGGIGADRYCYHAGSDKLYVKRAPLWERKNSASSHSEILRSVVLSLHDDLTSDGAIGEDGALDAEPLRRNDAETVERVVLSA